MSLSVLSHQQYTSALILCLWVYLATKNTQMSLILCIWVYLATNNTQMPSAYVSEYLTTNNTKMYLTTNNTQMPSSYVSDCT